MKLNAMMQRRWVRASLILAVFAAFAVWLEPTRVVWGCLRGEAFYDGRPTSWWERELGRWEITFIRSMLPRGAPGPVAYDFQRTRDDGSAWLRRIFETKPTKFDLAKDVRGPSLLQGSTAAAPILEVLSENVDEHIREMARYGLGQIESNNQRAKE